MGLTATSTGGMDFDPVAEGMHDAICYMVCDLGTQYNEMWSTYQHKVLIGWEIPGQRIEIERDGEKRDMPRVVSNQYTLSIGEKATLRKDLVSWRGRDFTVDEEIGFDISKLQGVNCQLQIIHKDKKKGGKFAKVNMVLPPKTGKPVKVETENDLIYYSIEDHKHDIPADVYPWVRDMIQASSEFKELYADNGADVRNDLAPPVDAHEDDIPF